MVVEFVKNNLNISKILIGFVNMEVELFKTGDKEVLNLFNFDKSSYKSHKFFIVIKLYF